VRVEDRSYDAIVVGGGIAGLTAAAYLSRAGHATLLCEKEHTLGGLVRTFERQGFWYDGGIRAMENSGIVYPMLRELGIEIVFLKSPVSVGIEDRVIRVESAESLQDYQALLAELYPESVSEIAAIVREIERVMGLMDVLYGIDNPAFMELSENPAYVLRVILPWMAKYALAVPRIAALGGPILDHLRRFTQNQSLLDIIAQHFFQSTPAFFALSYFSLYLDYAYPRGGTGALPEALASYIKAHRGLLKVATPIVSVDPERHTVTDAEGERYAYRQLVWAADLKALYRCLDMDALSDDGVRRAVLERRAYLDDKVGGDSILTLYLGVDLPPSYFREKASAHFFYTPSREGQFKAGSPPVEGDRAEIEAWLERFLPLTTYEISYPALRDETLAPPGKTGLIVSLLYDYRLTAQIEKQGWYPEFKAYIEERIVKILDERVFPGLRDAVVDRFSSTPLTLARLTGNTDGAITGWAYTNASMPAEHRMLRIARAVRTAVPDILQAGQWTYSPSGLPISILTGKLAADRAVKALGSGR
jgi:phytoene dehydrogenase-like protein